MISTKNIVKLNALSDRKHLPSSYAFMPYFHPFIGELLEQLNKSSINGLMDPTFYEKKIDELKNIYLESESAYYELLLHGVQEEEDFIKIKFSEINWKTKRIDFSDKGAYSIYNWELFFHIPFTIAVHLSKNQRFAEAQRWFHYIFDPSGNEIISSEDGSNENGKQYWKFLKFRQDYGNNKPRAIDELLSALSKPNDQNEDIKKEIERMLNGYENLKNNPFQPHVVARSRNLSYQYSVVMKYLDNLIAWGDSLFRQDTMETINEAIQLYVLANNILGPRPQKVPTHNKAPAKNFEQLQKDLNDFNNKLVKLESQLSFNSLSSNTSTDSSAAEKMRSLFGIGHTLYFCIPANDQLLSYWDIVADRFFKIRHCMNIEGVVRQLPLFEPPIDPGMLVKAAAAGIDINSIVSGLNAPLAPVRATFMIQKAMEICNEVRALGNTLLSIIEKKDNETLSLLRQKHEINIHKLIQDVRFLQYKEAEEATKFLIKSRDSIVEKYGFYQRLLGKKDEDLAEIKNLKFQGKKLTEENFDEIYGELIGQFDLQLKLEKYPSLEVKDSGKLYLNSKEDSELNKHLPKARDQQYAAATERIGAKAISLLGQFNVHTHPFGNGSSWSFGGEQLSAAILIHSDMLDMLAQQENSYANAASKTAAYERRADEWRLQSNSAACELMQLGKQIISSLIREEVTRHEYETQKKQIEQAIETDIFLHEKFTNQELYGWMQGELSRLYYEYYKFAFDIASKAEKVMKYELMRPELDAINFIKFNYWDTGRKGLLAGDSLLLDLKRMEMAYHDYNKREFELTKNISIKRLDPLKLLDLQTKGSCEISIPEWIFDLDCPGHYMRRIKNISLSIPCVAGPYTSINCTLTLLKSRIRRSTEGEYAYNSNGDDDRFVDYYGAIQQLVTSSAQNDPGLFETNLRDERFLPFEGAGVESTWKLELSSEVLPSDLRQFDYETISDVIMHIRYTARQGGTILAQKAIANIKNLIASEEGVGFMQLFNLKQEFAAEWHGFKTNNKDDFKVTILENHLPYIVKAGNISLFKEEALESKVHAIKEEELPTVKCKVEQLANKIEVSISKEDFEANSKYPLFLLLKYFLS